MTSSLNTLTTRHAPPLMLSRDSPGVGREMGRREKSKPQTRNFVLRRHQSIGAGDALEDSHYLSSSYVDTGDLQVLRDTSNPRSIVTGRTGVGKTALIQKLSTSEERVVRLVPDDLALSYLANNGVLQFFVSAGVKLDLFYRLLWRHIIAVELVRLRFKSVDDARPGGLLESIRALLGKNRAKEAAIDYLAKWGTSFWQATDYRVKEITSTLESDLRQSAGISLKASAGPVGGGVEFSSASADRLTEQQKVEVAQRGQQVVDRVQLADLTRVIELLDEDILVDPQKSYFVTIDALDENWVPDTIRYELIRALLETARAFNNKVRNVKIVVALREDLIDRVFRYTRDAGYQEEKYQSLYLELRWTKDQLVQLLDKRVNQLVREQYRGQSVTLQSLAPEEIDGGNSVDYIIARTLMRPRDVIAFFNKCMQLAEGRPRISKHVLLRAEGVYSLDRLRALADEWNSDFPYIVELAMCFKKVQKYFRTADVAEEFEERFLELLSGRTAPDITGEALSAMVEQLNAGDRVALASLALRTMYKVGIVGVKPESYLGVHWSFLGDRPIQISESAVYHVHPAFYRVLGVETRIAS